MSPSSTVITTVKQYLQDSISFFHTFIELVAYNVDLTVWRCSLRPALRSSEKPRGAWTGQAVISSREMGSTDRKSGGRGRRGPIWEVQCKQSRLLIIPAHVRNSAHFDVLPQRPLRPPIPQSQTACAKSRLGKGGHMAIVDSELH